MREVLRTVINALFAWIGRMIVRFWKVLVIIIPLLAAIWALWTIVNGGETNDNPLRQIIQ